MDGVDSEIQALSTDKGIFPASIAPAVGSYLCDLILVEKPLLAVEVGCYRGFSTLHIGKALQELGGPRRLVSFDLAPQEAEERVQRTELGGIVKFVAGNSSREGAHFFAGKDQVIDFIFMDGDHTRRGCFQDAKTFLPHLKIGGILVLHDIYPQRCDWLGPRYLIEALQKTASCFAIQEIADLDPFGIAVCRKQSEFPLRQLSPGLFARSHLAQLIETANFWGKQGKRTPWEIFAWAMSKRRQIATRW
jgi:predicted O-methyltransferase YrrM